MPERPNICYIFEKLRVQGCQIWHSHVSIPFNSAPAHSTRPHNAKKALYVIISFFPAFTTPRGIFGQKCESSNTQKMTENGPIWAKNGQKRTSENFGTTYLDPKSKNNCTLFSSIFQNFAPFPRYGRLKSKFLCERISQCVYSFCSIELTKTRNTWSLTAVT